MLGHRHFREEATDKTWSKVSETSVQTWADMVTSPVVLSMAG